MEFISLEFLIFFPIVVALNYLVKGKAKIVILTIISFYYYLTFARQYSIALLLLIVYSYILSYSFIFLRKDGQRKILLIFSTIGFIVVLIYFRYLNFVVENLGLLLNFNLKVPASPFFFFGISFVTFQLIGYFIDVYYKRIEVEKNFFNFTLFILFFPKINSGPIERGAKLLPQFQNDSINKIDLTLIKDGIKLFIWGYFAKVVISDRLSIAVNRVFSDPSGFDQIQILIGIIFFTFQVYTDFMGYTCMALGTSKILGFNLTNNFHLPFFSQSIGDFWKRWHISLSFWLRDYIFLPISYKSIRILNKLKHLIRKPENYAYIISTFVTMGICGIWHGPKWTYLVWGLIHAIYLISSFILKGYRKKFIKTFRINNKSPYLKFLRMIFVFCLIAISFVFFRANTLNEAFLIIGHVFTNGNINNPSLFFNIIDLYISFGMIAFLLFIEYIQFIRDDNKLSYQIHNVLNLGLIVILIIFIIYFGKFGESDFIYFKF